MRFLLDDGPNVAAELRRVLVTVVLNGVIERNGEHFVHPAADGKRAVLYRWKLAAISCYALPAAPPRASSFRHSFKTGLVNY